MIFCKEFYNLCSYWFMVFGFLSNVFDYVFDMPGYLAYL